MKRLNIRSLLVACVFAGLVGFGGSLCAGDGSFDPLLVQRLIEENGLLQDHLREQGERLEELTRIVNEMRSTQSPQVQSSGAEIGNNHPFSAPQKVSWKNPRQDNIVIGGEGGILFISQERDGAFPNSEFRIDGARLFVDAKLWESMYLFTELNIAERESSNKDLRVGELYVDFENVSRYWDKDGLLSIRMGRFDIPFGEEYLTRDAFDNALITHSLDDFWGVDEGIEIYGTLKNFQYVVALQSGGHPALRDFTADKSITGRIGYDPTRWLHMSLSAMRTGDTDVEEDKKTELWFGNDWFRSLGSKETTTEFHVNLVEGDLNLHWSRAYLRAAGGYIWYDDNDISADNHREVYYYHIEGKRNITAKLYGAARFSHVVADDGFPLVANGNSAILTEDLWALSLGLGYQWNRNLRMKLEYSFSDGEELGGKSRDEENLFAMELAFGF